MSIEKQSREAAARLLSYLAAEFGADGASRTAPDNVQFYYKLPAIFAYGGRRELAYRTLEQFTRRFIKQGALDLSADAVAQPWTPYLGGWAAWGAGALGRFDIAREIMKTVVTFHHPATGGYRFALQDGRHLLDVERTGAALMGCIWAGDLAEARAAAQFLRLALDRQPAPSEEFHAYLDFKLQVAPDRSDRNAFFSLSDPFARPALFATGIAGLVWLGRTTGDEDPMGLAQAYMQLVLAHRSDPAHLLLATKLGWSSMMLYTHRDDPELLNLARRSAENLIERQKPDGSIDFDALPDVPKPIEKVWHVGWGCDCALTLMAVADSAA
jgi:hypothetical protein